MAFIRISTSPRAFEAPFSSPTERHWEILKELLAESQAAGPLVMDAELATLAIEHGLTLCTNDRDFTRFSGLQTFNPLEGRTGL